MCKKESIKNCKWKKLAQTKINATSSENLPQVETKAEVSLERGRKKPNAYYVLNSVFNKLVTLLKIYLP